MEQGSLHEWEAKCIQEEPPRCKAACPLHVDGREFCKLLAAGQTDKAWAVLCRTLPFPAITARICDAPCKKACLREEVGGGIEMDSLERFCAENAKRTPPFRPLPSRGKTVAVLGGFLPGLAAAWDLAKKGFTVTVFLNNIYEAFETLPHKSLSIEIFKQEIEVIKKMGVTFIENSTPDEKIAEECLQNFDAVFSDPLSCCAEKLKIKAPSATTLETEKNGLFAASMPENETSPVALIAIGRKGALSIERFMQNASLSAGREREEPFETRLYTNISKVEPLAPVTISEAGYTPESAHEEASRCLLCECMECVKNCAYLENFKGYPKVFARQIYNNASIVMGTRRANNLINSCMLCDLCTEICPENFSMKNLCIEARQDLVEKGHMPPSAHEFALRDMEFADSETCTINRHQAGFEQSEWAFFPGCQLPASDPNAVKKVYEFLCNSLTGGTGLMLRCCAAPADWSGRIELFNKKATELQTDWESLGKPKLIAACPSCQETLHKAIPEAEITSLWSVLFQHRKKLNPVIPDTIPALQDPCTARHNDKLLTDVRVLLSDLGIEFTEPELSGLHTECCGFGGLLSNANEPLSKTVAERRASKLNGDGITYCAMCRDLLAKSGKRCLHILDVIFPPENLDPAARTVPQYSERRENRVRLKEQMLDVIWKKPSAPRPDFESIALSFTEEAKKLMEERRILISDIQKTINAVQKSGQELENTETGHKLVYYRPVTVTYWVEHEKTGENSYLIHKVWSHRMRILGGRK
ncbi:pyridine nucleotide-disulfide oxidoreductase/dicluster-binding protein [Maridesulfovibrio ferrireducens]|uniref:pyridine nucleotide-disulfide oxidoreductase/dicluster-binding protein n=1 Tax=Maridesulfovibrio ferrireducens TaxID=246191 RepID=UPI001A25DD6A|nr:pyridine nucleotide-disulfide oxidoreductase/dicluster-binding protein [Maridesulfovibrio ferrireducens]MBI9112916.1 4Fe-4S dicluster domain-containing protein [Maridesulfovibrio ferrireducens]